MAEDPVAGLLQRLSSAGPGDGEDPVPADPQLGRARSGPDPAKAPGSVVPDGALGVPSHFGASARYRMSQRQDSHAVAVSNHFVSQNGHGQHCVSPQ